MTDKVYLPLARIEELADRIAVNIDGGATSGAVRIFGVPRGGIPVAYAVAHRLAVIGRHSVVVDDPNSADVFVDDIVDSGATLERYHERFPDVPFYTLVMKQEQCTDWVVFPWEISDGEGSDESATDIVTRLLQYVGEDPEREGLVETPKRVLKAWDHWTSGYDKEPKDILKVFEDGAGKYDEMVIVRDIPVYSKCEHHLADIFGVAHVAYIPDGRIVGLSKLSRLVDLFARRLQVQERLTVQVADALHEHLKPKGVAVMLRCRHMCMESRGICQQGHCTVTTALRGVLKEHHAKDEFLKQVT